MGRFRLSNMNSTEKYFHGSFVFFVLLLMVIGPSCKSGKDEIIVPESITRLPFISFQLNDLNEFQNIKSEKWMIAGNAYANRRLAHHLEKSEGTGVLVNIPTEQDKVNIFTKLEHGDVDVQLDFMMPKGSNSGIYFQGRYEVQLLDSWLKDRVTFGDCGGIYERWANDKGFEGAAPALNAAKAPGLWQHLEISFRAPRFDNTGKKTRNAIFKEVWLNGTLIHRNVEVTGPTRSAAFEDEKPSGPIMIQGDHGPVAFKNIRYKTFGNDTITTSDIRFKVYKGVYRNYDTLKTLTPERIGVSDSLSWLVGDRKAQLVLDGKMNIPKDGDYLFKIKSGGASWLFIDDEEILDNDSTREYTNAYYSKLKLKAGVHPFTIIYANQDESLVLEYEGPGIPFTTLTTSSSERYVAEIEPFEYMVKEEPVFQRGFFKIGNTINPYAMAVGIPGGMNYVYDLNTYSMLSVWRGKFIDVSNMWTDRGETQREIPLGMTVELISKPNLLSTNPEGAWPDTMSADGSLYSNRGYRINEMGLPVFTYQYNDIIVEDSLTVLTDSSGLTRSLKLKRNGKGENAYFLLASANLIETLPDGAYAVDDKKYYIGSIKGIDPKNIRLVKAANGISNLVLQLPSGSANFNYSLIW